MKKVVLLFIFLNFFGIVKSQPTLDIIFRNSYEVFNLQRLPNGMYRDSKLFNGSDYHPVSIANTGMGLISLCIADSMNWINDAPSLALQTLKTATGHHTNFNPDRTINGYFRHFMEVNTGQQAWSSEYSTIDTDILMSGALFAMNYFKDDSISHYAIELWQSINFEAALANATTGKIYLSMNANGTGVANALTSPYSEYMIVAWLAKNATNIPNSIGKIFWANHYETPANSPKITYNGFEVLTDSNSSFLSSFTHQFNYFLCHHFTTSPTYLNYFENAQKADFSWWTNINNNQSEWGLGAGSAITNSYQANSINNNIDTIVSPHIIAGFLPVYPDGRNDLINLWNNQNGKYQLPTGNSILWRYSLNNVNWQPNEVIGIDYASMLFGLSTLPEYLGVSFFSRNNDFFPIISSTTNLSLENKISIYPNPCTKQLHISENHQLKHFIIYNILGKVIQDGFIDKTQSISVEQLKNGVYFIQFDEGEMIKFIKH